jgi:hypothetical protein
MLTSSQTGLSYFFYSPFMTQGLHRFCGSGEFWLDGVNGVKGCYYLEPSRYTLFYSDHPCIEAGTDQVVLTLSPHFGYVCPAVLNFPGRTEIRWPIGNFPKEVISGCVVGTAAGANEIEDSRPAFYAVMAKLEAESILTEYHDPYRSPLAR